MTLVAYLKLHPAPSEAEVREALSGNLCRCTGYQHIVEAALDAAGRPLTLPSPQRERVRRRGAKFVGDRHLRKEDPRLLTGRGR